MQVRVIQAYELDTVLALYAQLHPDDSPRPEPAVLQQVWQQALSNPNCRYFGAYVDERLVSTCTITVIPNLTRSCRPYGLIENVVTDAAFRGQGCARAVLAQALEFGWEHNCYKVMLMTGRRDEATLRFYEGAGFDRHSKQAFVAKPLN